MLLAAQFTISLGIKSVLIVTMNIDVVVLGGYFPKQIDSQQSLLVSKAS